MSESPPFDNVTKAGIKANIARGKVRCGDNSDAMMILTSSVDMDVIILLDNPEQVFTESEKLWLSGEMAKKGGT